MRGKILLISLLLFGLGLAVGRLSLAVVAAFGPIDPPGPPAGTSSYALNDIYNRLNAGTAGSPSTFTAPSSSPGAGITYTERDHGQGAHGGRRR